MSQARLRRTGTPKAKRSRMLESGADFSSRISNLKKPLQTGGAEKQKQDARTAIADREETTEMQEQRTSQELSAENQDLTLDDLRAPKKMVQGTQLRGIGAAMSAAKRQATLSEDLLEAQTGGFGFRKVPTTGWPELTGEEEPEGVRAWIVKTEGFFKIAAVPMAMQVTAVTTFSLKKQAASWWMALTTGPEAADLQDVTWVELKELIVKQ